VQPGRVTDRHIEPPIGSIPGLDLGLVLLGALGLTVLIALGGSLRALEAPRLLLGLTYALYVPGYTLQAALFPRPNDLDGPERSAASFALSLAVIPPIALLLDRLRLGIHPWPILVSLELFVVACTLVAWYRRRRSSVNLRASASGRGWRGRWTIQERKARAIQGGLVVVLAVALASLAVVVLAPGPGERLTEFYLLGPSGLAESFPRETTIRQPVSATVGIVNREGAPTTYRVEVLVGGQLVAEVGPVRLAPGARVEVPVHVASPIAGDDVEVVFHLYRSGDRAPYRSLRLWLSVKGS